MLPIVFGTFLHTLYCAFTALHITQYLLVVSRRATRGARRRRQARESAGSPAPSSGGSVNCAGIMDLHGGGVAAPCSEARGLRGGLTSGGAPRSSGERGRWPASTRTRRWRASASSTRGGTPPTPAWRWPPAWPSSAR